MAGARAETALAPALPAVPTSAGRKVGRKREPDPHGLTANSKLVFHIFGALAEFKRAITRERSRAGLEAACARSRRGGGLHFAKLEAAKRKSGDVEPEGQGDIAKAMWRNR